MQFIGRYYRPLMNVTRAGAIASAHMMGYNDRKGADKMAVEAMEREFNSLPCCFNIVCGEGERDKAPLLYHGQRLGEGAQDARLPVVDISIDPLEGTNLCANALPNAVSILAATPEGGQRPIPDWYLKKLVTGRDSKQHVDITFGALRNARVVAETLNREPKEITIGILDRPRHEKDMQSLKDAGFRLKRVQDGDILLALAVMMGESNLHMLWGIGGAPEGGITAIGAEALNGGFQAMVPHDAELDEKDLSKKPERLEERLLECDFKRSEVYGIRDFVRSNEMLLTATAVTNSDIIPDLRGVRFFSHGARTSTIVIGKSFGVPFKDMVENVTGDENTLFRL